MSRPWDADVDTSPGVLRRLIDTQFPELAAARIEPLAVGWDNAAFRVGDEWIFRLPRRKLGARCMEFELRWLPDLAPSIPARISAPEKIGRPDADYPYPFAGYRWIPGETGCRVTLSDAAASRLAGATGAVLAALHRLDVDPGASGDLIRRTDLPFRLERLKEPAARLAAAKDPDLEAAMSALRSLSTRPAWTSPRAWLHGDLYARHLVVAGDGGLGGIIDWGDVHAGDPAVDLSIAYSFFRGDPRRILLEAYGRVDAATLDRARFRALNYGVILRDYGLETGDEAMAKVGTLALRNGIA